jgi:hypothetical protein
MRGIRSVFCAAIAVCGIVGGLAAPAFAGSAADCHKPPPAWYTAPRVTHIYSVTYGRGYHRHGHTSRRSFSSRHANYRHAANRW